MDNINLIWQRNNRGSILEDLKAYYSRSGEEISFEDNYKAYYQNKIKYLQNNKSWKKSDIESLINELKHSLRYNIKAIPRDLHLDLVNSKYSFKSKTLQNWFNTFFEDLEDIKVISYKNEEREITAENKLTYEQIEANFNREKTLRKEILDKYVKKYPDYYLKYPIQFKLISRKQKRAIKKYAFQNLGKFNLIGSVNFNKFYNRMDNSLNSKYLYRLEINNKTDRIKQSNKIIFHLERNGKNYKLSSITPEKTKNALKWYNNDYTYRLTHNIETHIENKCIDKYGELRYTYPSFMLTLKQIKKNTVLDPIHNLLRFKRDLVVKRPKKTTFMCFQTIKTSISDIIYEETELNPIEREVYQNKPFVLYYRDNKLFDLDTLLPISRSKAIEIKQKYYYRFVNLLDDFNRDFNGFLFTNVENGRLNHKLLQSTFKGNNDDHKPFNKDLRAYKYNDHIISLLRRKDKKQIRKYEECLTDKEKIALDSFITVVQNDPLTLMNATEHIIRSYEDLMGNRFGIKFIDDIIEKIENYHNSLVGYKMCIDNTIENREELLIKLNHQFNLFAEFFHSFLREKINFKQVRSQSNESLDKYLEDIVNFKRIKKFKNAKELITDNLREYLELIFYNCIANIDLEKSYKCIELTNNKLLRFRRKQELKVLLDTYKQNKNKTEIKRKIQDKRFEFDAYVKQQHSRIQAKLIGFELKATKIRELEDALINSKLNTYYIEDQITNLKNYKEELISQMIKSYNRRIDFYSNLYISKPKDALNLLNSFKYGIRKINRDLLSYKRDTNLDLSRAKLYL